MLRLSQLLCLLLLAACAPQAASPRSESTGSQPERQRAPKVLTVAIQSEPGGFILELTQDNSRVGGVKQPKAIVHNLLTIDNDKGAWIPELATEQLSVDRGNWRLNPDGSMDTTWKIHPNVRWHDGAPFTTDDLLFSFDLFRDPEITTRVGQAARLMTSATAPDPQTLVVHWSAPFVDADQAPGLIPLPRHLLEEAYRTEKSTFSNSPHLSSEFVGLGPYKLVNWERGAALELVKFEQYWRGVPRLDRVIVRFLGDPTTMVANILSGAVDVVLPPAVDIEAALDVKQRWAGTNNQVLLGPSGNFRYLSPQLRPDLARPVNGLTNVSVRRALYHAMDRQALVDVLSEGMAPVADSWIAPSSPIRAQVEDAFPKYPLDLARASQLMAEAGWTRGSDGVLVNQQTGEKFEVELNGGATRYIEREQNIVGDSWKQIGAVITLYNVPPALANALENRVTRPGAGIYAIGESRFMDVPHTRNIPAPENRWTGSNYGAYANPEATELVERLLVTIPPRERIPMLRSLLGIVMGDIMMWPMYWDLTNVLALEGVKGIRSGEGGYHTWNFIEWDKA
jgi:peptide/nickel transport system substrate-binding protein